LFLELSLPPVIVVQRDLRIAPSVEVSDLMYALDSARRGAPFFGDVLALHIVARVFKKRNAGRPALLRAPTNNAALVDIEIAGTRSAAPFVFAALDQVVLEPVPAGI